MAEGFARSLLSESVEAYSAGTKPHGVNSLAVQVMKESGVDISHHHSKTLDELGEISLDLIVTVCDRAAATCPTPPSGTRVLHVPFDDPPKLAQTARDDSEALPHYRRVRDEIKNFILTLPTKLEALK